MNTIRSSFMVVLLIAFGAVVAQAQMVMVYVSGTSHTNDYLLSAVEAGVMDGFFNAGIIVFNAGTYDRVGDSEVQRRYWVRNTARQGGATHAIEVEVDLAAGSADSVTPEAASYRLVRVEPAEVLGTGRISASRLPADNSRSADRIGFQIGAEIARSALARL